MYNIHQNQVFLNFSWVSDPFKNLIKAVDSLSPKHVPMKPAYNNFNKISRESTDFLKLDLWALKDLELRTSALTRTQFCSYLKSAVWIQISVTLTLNYKSILVYIYAE